MTTRLPVPTKRRALELGASLIERELALLRERAMEDDRREVSLAERHVLSAIDLGISAGILRTLEASENDERTRSVIA